MALWLTKIVKISKIDWKLLRRKRWTRMKRAKPHPNSWEEWEGLHGDLPRWWARFCKMNTTPILAGLAKNRLLLNYYGVDDCQMEM